MNLRRMVSATEEEIFGAGAGGAEPRAGGAQGTSGWTKTLRVGRVFKTLVSDCHQRALLESRSLLPTGQRSIVAFSLFNRMLRTYRLPYGGGLLSRQWSRACTGAS